MAAIEKYFSQYLGFYGMQGSDFGGCTYIVNDNESIETH